MDRILRRHIRRELWLAALALASNRPAVGRAFVRSAVQATRELRRVISASALPARH